MEKINTLITNHVNSFRTQLVKTGIFAFRLAKSRILVQMEANEKGKLLNTEFNYSIVESIGLNVASAMFTGSFEKRLFEIAAATKDIFDITVEHYHENFGGLDSEEIREAQGIQKTAEQLMLLSMNQSALTEYILKPVMNSMLMHIINGSSRETMYNDTRHRILDRFASYLAPMAETQLQQYHRELSFFFAEKFDLVWVKYLRQPSDSDIRDFCSLYDWVITGIHWHKEEVKRFPEENGNEWDGMIAGTNSGNILTNLGGWNCLHSLVYVKASEVSAGDKNRAKSKGLI